MTTRYKIAEQVARIVSGGDLSEDNSIDIREIMLLVDQERNTLIKTEIMDWTYTKSTATAKGELEINGAWLSYSDLALKQDGSLNNAVYAELSGLHACNFISLPNDLGIHRVASYPSSFTRELKSVRLKGEIKETTYKRDYVDIIFNAGPKVLDDNYFVSFDFTIGTTLMSDGSTSQDQYGGVKTHNISFNVDTSGYNSYENQHFNFIKALVNSPGFKKFVKDFNIKYGVSENDPNDNTIVDTASSILHVTQVRLSTNYGCKISDFSVNGVGKNSISGGPNAEYGGASISSTIIENNIGLGWLIENADQSINSAEALTTAYENSHGLDFMINDTMYSSEFVSPEVEVSTENLIDSFIHQNSDKIAREQDIRVYKDERFGEWYLAFIEIEARGGFSLDILTPGTAFLAEMATNLSIPPSMAATNYEPIIYTRMPSGGDHNSLYNKTVDKTGRKFFYISSKQGELRLWLYKQYSLETQFHNSINVSYISTSEGLNDHDPYPIPGDYEKIIIKNLVEMFTVMRKATDDMINDNIK